MESSLHGRLKADEYKKQDRVAMYSHTEPLWPGSPRTIRRQKFGYVWKVEGEFVWVKFDGETARKAIRPEKLMMIRKCL